MNVAQLKKTGIVMLVVGIIVVGIGAAAYEQVPEGYTGVERQFGDVTGNTYDPGANWVAPWKGVQNVEIRERAVSWHQDPNEGEQGKRDAIDVKSLNGTGHNVDVTIRYKVRQGEETTFVERWSDHETFIERVLRPDIRSAVYQTASGVTSSTIHQAEGREQLELAATQAAREAVANEPVEITAVQVRHVSVPQSLREKYNERQEAKIEVQKKEHEIQAERKEKERQIIEAEAKAERIRIEGEALRENKVVLQQDQIEALKQGNTIYVPVGQDGMPMVVRPDDQGNSPQGNTTNDGG